MGKQQTLFKNEKNDYGGTLLNKRKARQKPRPLATKDSMHLILRSTQACGEWSFKKYKNEKRINSIVEKFADKYGVRIVMFANVGNHLHLQIQLASRYTYKAFIKAITGAIAQAVTQASRIKPLQKKFWDYRPFTRIAKGFRARLTLQEYVRVNQFEGAGYNRRQARAFVAAKTG